MKTLLAYTLYVLIVTLQYPITHFVMVYRDVPLRGVIFEQVSPTLGSFFKKFALLWGHFSRNLPYLGVTF